MNTKNVTLIGLVLFCILSFADLGLTWVLIQHGGGRVRESNPVAGAWLAGYGWHGLAWFKFATILVFATVALVLVRYRPRTGLLLVMFACLAVGWVVLYSYRLLPQAFQWRRG
jgi:hypothetical protein